MRIIDADELMEHVWRDKLDSRDLIAKMIDNAPTVKEISTKIPINIFEQLISQEQRQGIGYQEPFINKPCISTEVCEHDKNVVLDKIRAEISTLKSHHINDCYDDGFQGCRTNVLQIIDKYKAEIESQESEIENEYNNLQN